MPETNALKEYIKGSYYHIYNRGVNRNKIFFEECDYIRFIDRMKKCLLISEDTSIKAHKNNVKLLCYCLIDNHVHLLVQNKTDRGIEKFCRSIFTSHSLYINNKYNRVGHLYQERYKAKLIKTDLQLLAVSRYIHRNPLGKGFELENYPYSSYFAYKDPKYQSEWLEKKDILLLLDNDLEKATKKYMDFIHS